MQISLRSQLTAGMVAVVGAGAIAMTPVVVPVNSALSANVAAPVAVDVQLAAWSFSDVLGILNSLGISGALPDLTALTDLLPANVLTAAVTEFVNGVTPVITGAATDVFAYLGTTVTGLVVGPDSVLARIIAAVGDVPGVVATAVQSLSTGNLASAVQVVVTGLAAPFTAIGEAIADAVQSFQSFVTTKITSIAGALPGILANAVQVALAGNAGSLLGSIQTALTNWLSGLVPGAAAVAPAAAAVSAGVTAGAAAAGVVVAPAAAAVTKPKAAPRAASKRSAATAPAGAAAATGRSHAAAAAVASDSAKAKPGPRAAASRHAVRG